MINKKLIVIILGLLLVSATIFYAIFMSTLYQKEALKTAQRNLMDKAENIEVFIETALHEQLNNISIMSKTAEIVHYANEKRVHQENNPFCPLHSIQHLNLSDFIVVALLDTNGIPYHLHIDSSFNNFSSENISKLQEIRTVNSTHQAVVGENYSNDSLHQIMNLVFPIFSEKHFVGSIFVSFNVTSFCQRYFSNLLSDENSVEIADAKGNYLFNSNLSSPNLQNILHTQKHSSSHLKEDDFAINEVWVNQFNQQKKGIATVVYQDKSGNTSHSLIAQTPISLGNNIYMVAVHKDIEKAISSSHRYTMSMYLVLFILIVLFIFLWIFGWAFLKNFIKIRKEVKLLSKITQSESRYWDLFNTSPMPLVVISPSGTISIGNQQFINYLGLIKTEDIYGRKIFDFIQFKNKESFKKLTKSILNDDSIKEEKVILTFQRKKEDWRTAEFITSKFTFDKKKNILCLINDLTEKRMGENLSHRFGRILNNAHNEIYVINATTHLYVHATDGALKNLGYTIDELTKLTPDNILKFKEGSFQKTTQPFFEGNQQQLVFETMETRKDGTEYPVEITLQLSQEENPPVFIALVRDISLVKTANLTIASERARSREYLEMAEVMFVVITATGNISLVNRKGCEVLEYQQSELIGKSWIDVCTPEDARSTIALQFTTMLNGTHPSLSNFESQIVTKNGQHKLISWQHKVIKHPNNEVIGILSSGLDITESKKQQHALNISQRQYATLIENIDGIVYRCEYDASWTMKYISHGVFGITGYLPEELVNNKHVAFSNIIHPDDQQFVKTVVEESLKHGDKYQLEYRIIKKNNDIIWVTENGQTIYEDNKIHHLEGFITDITQIKETDIQLKKLSTAIDQSSSSIVITDNSGTIEYVNPWFCSITGFRKEEIIHKKVSILKSGLMQEKVYADLWSTISTGKTWYGEFHNKRKNGKLFWESAVIAPVKDANGTISSYIAIKQDITKHKEDQQKLAESQERLKQSEAQFKALSKASFEAIFISKHGHCIGQNKTAELIFGYSDEEVIGKNETYWFAPEERQFVTDRLSGGSEDPFELNAIRKNNSRFPCEIKTRVAEYQGNMVLFTAITDISRRKEAQQNLLESEARYRALIQNNVSIMMLFDPFTGEIVEVNTAACLFYGLDEQTLKNTNIFDLNTLEKREIEPEIQQLLSGEKSYFVFKHRIANGDIKNVELYTGQIDFQGRELYFSVIHDITEKIQITEELILSKEKAEESDRLKSAFLANMSHEIRTPMNAIIGFSQLLNDDDISEEESENYIKIINQSGLQLLNLIDDIIKISQIEAGIIDIQNEACNLTEILQETFNLFSLTVRQKGVKLILDVPKEEIKNLLTDASRLKQILINLLSNALKFTHEGEVRFGYRIKNNSLQFFVKDTGIGIHPDHHKLIFGRFMQVEQVSRKLYGGTGIGLSISQALVEKMGGKIWLESAVNQGTAFFFTLPNNQPNTKQISNEIKVTDQNKPIVFADKNILIIEDNDSNRQLLQLFLEPTQAKLLFAINGQDGVDIVNSNYNIDLILMDIKMPILNGIEATKMIKKKHPSLPIIIQTAYAMTNEKEEAFAAGCDAYIAKPVGRKDLLQTVSNLI